MELSHKNLMVLVEGDGVPYYWLIDCIHQVRIWREGGDLERNSKKHKTGVKWYIPKSMVSKEQHVYLVFVV